MNFDFRGKKILSGNGGIHEKQKPVSSKLKQALYKGEGL